MTTTKKIILKIKIDRQLAAIVIRKDFSKSGIEFFSPGEFSQQLGYMKRPKGYKIPPHLHLLHPREIKLTQETLLVKSGKVKVKLYNQNKLLKKTLILKTGDVILLASGGHGFEFLEESELIEIKQGPYMESEDKVRFEDNGDS
jgi:hypothetical protein